MRSTRSPASSRASTASLPSIFAPDDPAAGTSTSTATSNAPRRRHSLTAGQLGARSLAATAAKNEHKIRQLVPLAELLAFAAGPEGIIVGDLREAAVTKKYLTGRETREELCFLGAVMRRAKLVNTGRSQRSKVKKTHGNPNLTWVHPRWVSEGVRADV